MLIGVPKEIKADEYRVGMIPATVRELTGEGHDVWIETRAGEGAGISDAEYVAAGAQIITTAEQIYSRAALIVKVKEPLAAERKQLRGGQIIFTYLHLAADAEQARDLIASGATAIAYETVTDSAGKLPLLAPMSKIAGRMAPQVAAHFLERPQGGRGILLGGIDGVPAAQVVVLGGGVVGSNATEVALGMGANVIIIGHTAKSLDELARRFEGRDRALVAQPEATESLCASADAVIAAALVPGGAAPRLISAGTVKLMKPGAVIIDVSIDQGGCAETSHPTTHAHPTFAVDGVLHYCVANMPGAVPRTSTFALNNATRPFIVAIANKGLSQALIDNRHLRSGLNVHEGQITCRAVADALQLPYTPADDVLTV